MMVWDKACRSRGHRNDQSRQGHQCSKTSLTGESLFHISTPQGIWTRVPYDRKQMGSPQDQGDMVRMKWDCRVSTNIQYVSYLFRYDVEYTKKSLRLKSTVMKNVKVIVLTIFFFSFCSDISNYAYVTIWKRQKCAHKEKGSRKIFTWENLSRTEK